MNPRDLSLGFFMYFTSLKIYAKMICVMHMTIISKLITLIKRLFYWIKYFIIILICFIYALFKSDNPKLTKEKKNLQLKRQELLKKTNPKSLPTTHEDNSLINNSIFTLTEELIKEKIILFYCQEKELKQYELTKKDDEIIKEITKKIIPQIKLEEKYLKKEEQLEELIKKLGQKELNPPPKEIKDDLSYQKDAKAKTENMLKPEVMNQFISSDPIKTFSSTSELKIAKPISHPEIKPVYTSPIPNTKQLDQNKEITKESKIVKTPFKTKKRKLTTMPTPLKVAVISIPLLEILHITNMENKEKTTESQKQSNTETKEKTKVVVEKSLESVKTKEPIKKEAPIKIKKQENRPQNKNTENKPEKLMTIDLTFLKKEVNHLVQAKIIEQEKENLEDKNYEAIIRKSDILLKKIEDFQTLPLTKETQEQLNAKKLQLMKLKENIEIAKTQDITKEEKLLEENITNQELRGLETELQKLYLEHQIDLNNHLIYQAENLENLSQDKLRKVEKELIKQKIKKASRTLELPSILLFPFIRNRYFFMFTTGLILNNHIHILDHLLKHKSVTYESPDLESIKKGSDALENALQLTNTNISYLSFLENNILSKYPELSADNEYLIYINKLKSSLMQNQEKMFKKKEMIRKYNLKYQAKIRKLQKKKIA